LLKYAEAIKFDEDLVIIVTTYLKFGGEISEEILQFFYDIEVYITKNDGITLDCFEFLNIFLLNGICNFNKNFSHDHIQKSFDFINSFKFQSNNLLLRFIKIIKKGYSEKSEKRMSHFLSYNLLCILLQVYLKN